MAGGDAIFIKFSKVDGSIIWAKQLGAESQSEESANRGTDIIDDLYVDETALYAVGNTTGNMFDENGGSIDALFLKIDKNNGDVVWGKQIGDSFDNLNTTQSEQCRGIVVDESAVYGSCQTTGPLVGANGLTDLFYIKLEKDTGSLNWIKHYGKSYNNSGIILNINDLEIPRGLTQDESFIYGTGDTSSSLGESSAGNSDFFIIKVSKDDGEPVWLNHVGRESSVNGSPLFADRFDTCNDIAVDESFVYCGGNTESNLSEINSGMKDAFISKFSKTDGELIYIKQLGQSSLGDGDGSYDDTCNGLALDESRVYCGGSTFGNLFEENGGGLDAFIFHQEGHRRIGRNSIKIII